MAADATMTPDDEALFERLMEHPTPEGLYSTLSADQFERFLEYLFYCAGFMPEFVGQQRFPNGPGVDLNLYSPSGMKRPVARVEAKRYDPASRRVSLDEVRSFVGTLSIADGIPGYLITTADFAANAREAAAEHPRKLVRLVNGQDLVRYITYISGSRIRNADGKLRTPSPIAPDWMLYDSSTAPRSSAHILTVANNKGGIGKTTTALNIGLGLAGKGFRVLLVDLDGQANLSAALPLPDPRPRPPKNAPVPPRVATISRYFTGEMPRLASLIQPTRFERVWVLPSDEQLHRIDSGGGAQPDEELTFAQAIRSNSLNSAEPFDWIVLDTPPGLSFFTRLALAAADVVLMPLRADTFSTIGLGKITRAGRAMQALLGEKQLHVAFLTHWREVKSAREAKGKLETQVAVTGVSLLSTVVSYDDRIEQAHILLHGGGTKTLFAFKGSSAATEYRHLVEELLRKVGAHDFFSR